MEFYGKQQLGAVTLRSFLKSRFLLISQCPAQTPKPKPVLTDRICEEMVTSHASPKTLSFSLNKQD